jgi:hypothetical protein
MQVRTPLFSQGINIPALKNSRAPGETHVAMSGRAIKLTANITSTNGRMAPDDCL